MGRPARIAEADLKQEPVEQKADVKEAGHAGEKRRRRPLMLKVLVVGYLLLSWFGWMRMIGGLQDWSLLSTYLSGGMLVYLVAGGVLWGLAGLASAISLWFGMSIAPWTSRVTAFVCFIWYWLDRLFLTRTPLADTNLLFAGVATLLLLAFALTIPALPRLKRFFGKGT